VAPDAPAAKGSSRLPAGRIEAAVSNVEQAGSGGVAGTLLAMQFSCQVSLAVS
jgi:hypothetical protein